jgi:DNA-binding NtrC family response regulator
LFGHAKGAFTGASAAKVGLFEAATGGTIFLDEIGSTSPETQQSLLRVLQEREIRRVGETGSRSVDVRVLSATNANLESEIRAGRFRSDLYFRLGRVILRLPPLRDRVEDIPLLADHLLAASCRRHGRKLCRLSPRATEKLTRHSWPGNIRELENVIEGAVIFAQRGLLGPSDLSIPQMDEAPSPGGAGEDLSLQAVMRDHITKVLERCGGNKKQAAGMLGIPRTSLYKRMKRLGLE